MSNLMQLKHRIKSIETTKKVTHAMRLIAISFYGQIQKRNTPLIAYKESILNLLTTLQQSHQTWKNPLFITNDPLNSNPLIIFISTSKGLCGSFHEKLATFFEHHFFAEEHQELNFISVGSKATYFIEKYIEKENKGKLVTSLEEVNLQNSQKLAEELYTQCIQNNYSSVIIYSNNFISFFTQKPTQYNLLPISQEKALNKDKTQNINPEVEYIWEQDKDSILDKLTQTYIKSSLESLCIQSLLAEQAARFLAMENATTSATKYITSLTLQYNKTRQDMVTKEIIELSTAAAD